MTTLIVADPSHPVPFQSHFIVPNLRDHFLQKGEDVTIAARWDSSDIAHFDNLVFVGRAPYEENIWGPKNKTLYSVVATNVYFDFVSNVAFNRPRLSPFDGPNRRYLVWEPYQFSFSEISGLSNKEFEIFRFNTPPELKFDNNSPSQNRSAPKTWYIVNTNDNILDITLDSLMWANQRYCNDPGSIYQVVLAPINLPELLGDALEPKMPLMRDKKLQYSEITVPEVFAICQRDNAGVLALHKPGFFFGTEASLVLQGRSLLTTKLLEPR